MLGGTTLGKEGGDEFDNNVQHYAQGASTQGKGARMEGKWNLSQSYCRRNKGRQ